MDAEQFAEIMDTQFRICKDVLLDKRREYAGPEDVLHNFRTASDLQNVPMRRSLAGMMAKHTISIYDLCNSESMDILKWEEKIVDHINYLVLLHAIVVEEKELQDDIVEDMMNFVKEEMPDA